MGKSSRSVAQPGLSPNSLFVLLLLILAMLVLAVRVRLLSTSLWYDEIYTVAHFTEQPWSTIVSGTYSPNNHILSSLLIKASEQAGALAGLWAIPRQFTTPNGSSPLLEDSFTLPFRLSSIIAGTLVCFAMAWPLRRRTAGDSRFSFYALVLLAAFQPWLLVFSTEARGYVVALLFAVIATNLLSQLNTRRWLLYVLATTAAIYTIPISGLLLAGHAAAILLSNRSQLKRWALSVVLILTLSTLLYSPFLSQMPRQATGLHSSLSYVEFLFQCLRHASSGWNTPGPAAVVVTLLLLCLDLPLAWCDARLRIPLITFGVTAALSLLLPLTFPSLRQARFAFWLIPVMVFSCYGLLMCVASANLGMRITRGVAALLLAAWTVWQISTLSRVHPQRNLEGIVLIDQKATADAVIGGIYLGAFESAMIYAPFLRNRPFVPIVGTTFYGRLAKDGELPPWCLVVFPELLRQDVPALDELLHRDYEMVEEFPGRYSDVQVWRLRTTGGPAIPTSNP
jgi:hypothetical protein